MKRSLEDYFVTFDDNHLTNLVKLIFVPTSCFAFTNEMRYWRDFIGGIDGYQGYLVASVGEAIRLGIYATLAYKFYENAQNVL